MRKKFICIGFVDSWRGWFTWKVLIWIWAAIMCLRMHELIRRSGEAARVFPTNFRKNGASGIFGMTLHTRGRFDMCKALLWSIYSKSVHYLKLSYWRLSTQIKSTELVHVRKLAIANYVRPMLIHIKHVNTHRVFLLNICHAQSLFWRYVLIPRS